MQMEDRLAGLRIGVDDGSVTGAVDALPSSHLAGHGQHVTQEQLILLKIVIQRNQMLARNDKQMNRRFGIDVLKYDTVFVLVKDFCGLLMSRHLAKNAYRSLHFYSKPILRGP